MNLIPPAALGIGKTIYGEGIIPPRLPIPNRIVGFPLTMTDELLEKTPTQLALDVAMEKLGLEDERIRRILPALPVGYSWRGEVQSHEHIDFARDHGDVSIRLVYRLYGPDGEKLDMSAREAWARHNGSE